MAAPGVRCHRPAIHKRVVAGAVWFLATVRADELAWHVRGAPRAAGYVIALVVAGLAVVSAWTELID